MTDFDFYQDPVEATEEDPVFILDEEEETDMLEDADKENVAPPRPRRDSKMLIESTHILSPGAASRVRIPISYSTTDLPGSIGDVVRKRPADEDESGRASKQMRLDI